MEVLLKAKVLLSEFETPKINQTSIQPSLFQDTDNSEVIEKLKSMDLYNMTPIDVVNYINDLRKSI